MPRHEDVALKVGANTARSRSTQPQQRKRPKSQIERRDRLPENWDTMSFEALSYQFSRARGAPQTTIDAIVYTVRVRGLAALTELANIERLSRCGAAAKSEINKRIAKLITAKEIAA